MKYFDVQGNESSSVPIASKSGILQGMISSDEQMKKMIVAFLLA